MRTPNTKCTICSTPLHRKPKEFLTAKEFCCRGCRGELYKRRDPSPNLALGRRKGTNNLTGTKRTDETRAKMSESMRAFCAENPDRVAERGLKTRGGNHYLWQGGVNVLNKKIRHLNENRKWMDAVKKRDGFRCVDCGSSDNIESHHIKELSDLVRDNGITSTDEALRCAELWDIENGRTLCRGCHYKTHNRKSKNENIGGTIRKAA